MKATKTILMVDDSKTALTLQRMMLAHTGYNLLAACDGKRGVELAIEYDPDLILMDVVMPEMTGFDAVRCIRKHPALHETPIIMVTTRGESANVAEGFSSGCTAYITKPFNANELLEKILAQLEDGDADTQERLIERQQQALMGLYVTTHELFEAREPGHVLAIILEVVVNLIGCEEVAIYAVADLDGVSILVPEKTLGLSPERIAKRVRFGEGLLGEVAASGQCFMPSRPTNDERPAHERGITACVPLCFAEQPVAVLVLYGLLGHKVGGLTPVDRQLLAMLSHQTGLAMQVAELRARAS